MQGNRRREGKDTETRFTIIELDTSKEAKHTTTESTKTFHSRESHSENCYLLFGRDTPPPNSGGHPDSILTKKTHQMVEFYLV